MNKTGEDNSKHQLKELAMKSQCDSLRQERHPVHVRSRRQYIFMHILLLEHSYLGWGVGISWEAVFPVYQT